MSFSMIHHIGLEPGPSRSQVEHSTALPKRHLIIIEPRHDISNNVVCAYAQSDRPLIVACIFYECYATD